MALQVMNPARIAKRKSKQQMTIESKITGFLILACDPYAYITPTHILVEKKT